jgi:hypothetical protein
LRFGAVIVMAEVILALVAIVIVGNALVFVNDWLEGRYGR